MRSYNQLSKKIKDGSSISSIENLEVDIDNLENTIKNAKAINLKRSVIKNIKITSKIAKVLLPFILIPTATYAMASALHMTPIKIDYAKNCQNLKREYDNRNNETIEYIDKPINEYNSELLYIGKWSKSLDESALIKLSKEERNLYIEKLSNSDEDYYVRENRTYPISLDKVALIKGLFETDKDKLIDYLGEPTKKQIVLKKDVTPEELEEDSYIKVTTYESDNTYCTIERESTASNVACTVLYLVGTGTLTILTATVFDVPRLTLESDIFDIKADYIPIDEKDLRKELTIKKEIYESLTGKTYEKSK